MNDAYTSANPARVKAVRAVGGNGGGSWLRRRTFLIAFLLVSGGLITSGAIELFLMNILPSPGGESVRPAECRPEDTADQI
jgi:hypothetical protein